MAPPRHDQDGVARLDFTRFQHLSRVVGALPGSAKPVFALVSHRSYGLPHEMPHESSVRRLELQNGQSGWMASHRRVVVLNGPSSSGKTTLATAFRDQRAAAGDFWFMTGIDDFLAKLPVEWQSAGSHSGPRAAEGVRFERTDGGLEVRVGSVGRQLIRAYQLGVAAAANAGLNVIVDEVVIDETSWDDWASALAGHQVVWVGIRCSLEVAERRERSRPERYAGLTRGQAPVVHRFAHYDFEIDTTARSEGEVLADFARLLPF
jgi:chloramphenicol 3-O phosphotransferase